MSFPMQTVPLFPTSAFLNLGKSDFRKPHTLSYRNGYAVQKRPLVGVGLEPIEANKPASPKQLLETVGTIPQITYGSKQFHNHVQEPRFLPAHVAFDKVVLRFDGYFKQTVHESTEQYLLRKIRIYYFLEDDSISVVEPPVENSGIPQGVLIRRQRLPKNSTEYYTVRDFNLGVNVTFYGKTFRVINCDKFTEKYLRETEHIELNSPEVFPRDPYYEHRNKPTRASPLKVNHNDKLRRFLEYDRKVLRFYCVWDDRHSMFGELREFVLHYFLVDDCVEIREVQKPNNGRDPVPILLRRQPLPKGLSNDADSEKQAYYNWRDLKIGSVIDVLGRKFLIRDADECTKKYLREKAGASPRDLDPITYGPTEGAERREPEIPPYNGFGSPEDSLGSCKYLVLQPPKKDFIKLLENEHKVLRFVARMESKHVEDKDRRFVISYRLADDHMTIYEPPRRNAGFLGGKFMERTRVLKPGSSLSSPKGPVYYDATDLHVGGVVEVFRHKFILMDADDYVFAYMESLPQQFTQSNFEHVINKARKAVEANPPAKSALESRFKAADPMNTGALMKKDILEAARSVWSTALTEHEVITLLRRFQNGSTKRVDYVQLLNAL